MHMDMIENGEKLAEIPWTLEQSEGGEKESENVLVRKLLTSNKMFNLPQPPLRRKQGSL